MTGLWYFLGWVVYLIICVITLLFINERFSDRVFVIMLILMSFIGVSSALVIIRILTYVPEISPAGF